MGEYYRAATGRSFIHPVLPRLIIYTILAYLSSSFCSPISAERSILSNANTVNR